MSTLQDPLKYFYDTGPDDISRSRMTTLPFLLLALSPFVIFDSDNPLISCPLCKTLWNNLMIQDQTTYPVQEWQLCLSCFWRYLPLLCPLILCPLYKSKTLWNIFMILGRNVERTRRHVGYKNDNSAILTFGVISLFYVWQWGAFVVVFSKKAFLVADSLTTLILKYFLQCSIRHIIFLPTNFDWL